jgi:hypothetical protein
MLCALYYPAFMWNKNKKLYRPSNKRDRYEIIFHGESRMKSEYLVAGIAAILAIFTTTSGSGTHNTGLAELAGTFIGTFLIWFVIGYVILFVIRKLRR